MTTDQPRPIATAAETAPETAAEIAAAVAALPYLDTSEVDRRCAELAVAPTDPDLRRRGLETAITLVDLTSLEAGDTPAGVRSLARRARTPDPDDPTCPSVAAVCVYPDLVAEVADELTGSPVRVASVAGGFPSSRSPLEVKLAEVRAALAAGADELDVVLDRGAFLDGRLEEAAGQLTAIVAASGDAHVKVILETGALPDADSVQRAAWLALLAGADVVKTSTGKDGPGASLPATLVLLEVTEAYEARTGRTTGVKAAGGIRTHDEALAYLALVSAVRGDGALTPDRFRFGASSLLADLVAARRAAARTS